MVRLLVINLGLTALGFLAGWWARKPELPLMVPSAVPPSFRCKARTASGPDVQDCDWPHCGCDPLADRVLASLQEEGYLSPKEAAELVDRAEKAEQRLRGLGANI
jgi:hypothetical protein